ncbi:MAG: N-acyl homoserine lactone hydrolase [Chloroflexota bacterium]|nr:N-acyl homoserine lactone hydrolase [Chloroflexota bacterium]
MLKADLPAEAQARMEAIEVAPYDEIWDVMDQGPHSRVRALPAGKLALYEGDRPTGVTVPIVAYVLRAGNLTMAIDAGLGARWRDGGAVEEVPDGGPDRGLRYLPVLDGPTFAELLSTEGIRLDRAVCTHLHVDHAGGARALGLPVGASTAELAAALGGGGGYPADDLAGVEFAPIDLDRGPVGPFAAHAVLAPGILALSTPGHTVGSISIFACLGATWALICGDAAYPRADEPGSEAYLGMLRIRRALGEMGGTLVLAGHDTAALRACAGGAWLGMARSDHD